MYKEEANCLFQNAKVEKESIDNAPADLSPQQPQALGFMNMFVNSLPENGQKSMIQQALHVIMGGQADTSQQILMLLYQHPLA